MLRPRTPYLLSLGLSVAALVIVRLGEAALKAIFDVTVQDYWKDTTLPFLSAHVGPWSAAVLEWIGPYWLGAGSAFLLMFCVEMLSAWRRKRRKIGAFDSSAPGLDPEDGQGRLDRRALADEAEVLARQLSKIAAESEGREQTARDIDGAQFVKNNLSGVVPSMTNDATNAAQEKTALLYGQYNYEYESIIDKASRFIAHSRSELWSLDSRVTSSRDLNKRAQYLIKVAHRLRYSQPSLPLSDKRTDEA